MIGDTNEIISNLYDKTTYDEFLGKIKEDPLLSKSVSNLEIKKIKDSQTVFINMTLNQETVSHFKNSLKYKQTLKNKEKLKQKDTKSKNE